ncbi:MAG: type II secretion system protein [Lentisphaeria bacterium]|nr:type II secretion system protein [Lentisphaeria bacterium]
MKKNFTLIELLVVIAIIGILASLLLPSLQRAAFSARLVACKSNLRQIAIGLTTYTVDYDGFYPEGKDDGVGEWAEGRPTSYQINNVPKYNALAEYFNGGYGDYRDITYRNKLWKCPEGVRGLPPERSDAQSYYSMFFNVYHGSSSRANSPEGYRYSEPANVMRKAGWEWTMKYVSKGISGLKFDVLAADLTRGQGSSTYFGSITGVMTNHIWGGYKANHYQWQPLYQAGIGGVTSVNYVFTDGGARTFEVPTAAIWSQTNTADTFGFATKDAFLTPREYGSE